MRVLATIALALIATAWLSAARADGPRMLLANSWSRLPDQAELQSCPLDAALQVPSTGLTVEMTCDVNDFDGRLRACHADERADPRLQAYALCVARFFEVRPGVHGQVIVPIGIAPPDRHARR